MPALAYQFPLGFQRRLPVFMLGRQVLVGHSAVRPELFVLNGIARTGERFGVEKGRRRDQPGLDERRQYPSQTLRTPTRCSMPRKSSVSRV